LINRLTQLLIFLIISIRNFQVLRNQQQARAESTQRQNKILRADPMDIEAQRLIEEVLILFFYIGVFKSKSSYDAPF